jgi:5'-3' exonuclease
MAFDRQSWRKSYTASDLCISKKPYKGNRRKDMSPSQQAKYQRFLNHLREFESLIIEHTTIISLFADGLEADDLIAGFVQTHPDDELVIISADNDLLQLHKHPNIRQISISNDKELSLEEYNNDADYFLFVKCIRGDAGDNVMSAFPRVRLTKLEKAYTDTFEKVQIMKSRWKDHDGNEFLVEDVYEENRLLMDLEQQPEVIRKKILSTIKESTEKQRKFSMFHMMKYLGKYELEKIKESIDQYLPMLSK